MTDSTSRTVARDILVASYRCGCRRTLQPQGGGDHPGGSVDEPGDIVARLILSPAIEFSHIKGDNIMDNICST